ncbi:MAG: hypothetical protein JXB32_07950, partial [Deltaproteobacteria bacterium]|nr:hypothetical protein [Deltaproteobacteria bacterium]
MTGHHIMAPSILLAVLALGLDASPAAAQTQIKPYIMIVFDTSGSMAWTSSGSYTWGDGTRDPWGSRWCCPGTGTAANPSRLYACKNAMHRFVSATGDIAFGLTKFPQIWTPAGRTMDWYRYNQASSSYDVLRYRGACSSSTVTDYRVVDIDPNGDNVNQILMWMDQREYSAANTPISSTERELRADGSTPIAWSLTQTETYLGTLVATDTVRDCRPYRVILLTDGEETCGGDPVAAVTSLRTTVGGGHTKDVRTCVIVYGSSGVSTANAMASAGRCFDSTTSAFTATNEDELAVVLFQIIEDTVLVEVCNGVDDDCDTLIDEGFTLYCNRPSHPAVDLCTDPGETRCDGIDDNCNGLTDEGLLNLCGTCGPAPTEICDLIDNDCDTLVDEGGVCVGDCIPTAEICNNVDDDCDGLTDEGVTRPCGTDIGECVSGTQTCTAGVWGACAGSVGPTAEVCDNRDNDCDGRTDGFTRPCGSSVGVCTPGTQICTSGSWSTDCVGAYSGGTEVCNLLDDDCDGATDEGDPGGGGECGGSVGECLPGIRHCVGGTLVCVGGTEPVPEVCDLRDNDCDGSTDEGNPGGGAGCYSGPAGTEGVGVCEGGVVRCLLGALVCDGEVLPTAEDCNNLDDDCDTETDEGLTSGATCGSDVGECSTGTNRCVAGAWVCEGEVGPETEICDLLDNDCDTATDEGNPGGGLPCGWDPTDPSVWDLGICEPGISNCVEGAIVCEGMIGPVPEECNALDDDCNGLTDDLEDTGTPCGSDVGECLPGTLQCLDGRMQCVGGRGPTDELCDCLDNDCDGETDEGAECGGGASCIDCVCVMPCDPGIELNCPTGRICECGVDPENPTECFCMPDTEECGGGHCNACQDCIEDTCVDVVVCSDPCQACQPATGRCVDRCEGMPCDPGLVCECGVCEIPDCYSAGHECPAGQQCEDGVCVDDPCYDVSCPPPQFCRDGTCHDPCGLEDVCEPGQVCYDGECVPDPCYEVTCDPGETCAGGTCSSACAEVECSWPLECDPATGECEEPACWDLECPEGYDCVNGTCVERWHPADDA